jgi:hypothetical protein
MMKPKTKHGGARPGAGRKPGQGRVKWETISLSASDKAELVAFAAERGESQGACVRACVDARRAALAHVHHSNDQDQSASTLTDRPRDTQGCSWNDISQDARETMKTLGDFGPTVFPENREIKGYPQEDGKTYYDADELRKMATHFVEVANWLDARALSALPNNQDNP